MEKREQAIKELLKQSGVSEISIGKFQPYEITAKYGADEIKPGSRILVIEDQAPI